MLPARDQVLRLLDTDLTYEQVAQRLAISPGLAYMIATGLPADGSDALTPSERSRPGYLQGSTQHLANRVQPHNPTGKQQVVEWMKQRAAADTQMTSAAATAQTATEATETAAAAEQPTSDNRPARSGKHAKTPNR